MFGIRTESSITVDETESNYIRVLKLSTGDTVELFLDDGIYTAEFVQISKHKYTFDKLIKIETETAHNLEIDLLFGICDKDNIRDILDFGTQVGVRNFFPVRFDFSAGKKSEPFLEKKGETIIREAVRQCRRTDVPKLHTITKDVSSFSGTYQSVIIADLTDTITELSPPEDKQILVVIGPESGLSESDVTKLKCTFPYAKILTVSPIVMRAQIAVVGVINYIRGALR